MVFAIVGHVLSIAKFECLGDVGIQDDGVVPKGVREIAVQRGVICLIVKGWVAGGYFLGEVLFVEEGKLCVKVSDGPFLEVFTL